MAEQPIDAYATKIADPRLVDLVMGLDSDKARYLAGYAETASRELFKALADSGVDASEHGEFYITVGYRRGAKKALPAHEEIHRYFELTYAQYLTIPRSVLQSMPDLWQERFVALLEKLDDAINWRPEEGRYWVTLKDSKGRFVRDPFQDYERGRRRIPLNKRDR